MGLFETGEDEMSCPHCGAVHRYYFTDFPVPNTGQANCQACGRLMLRWDGRRDYSKFRLRSGPRAPAPATPAPPQAGFGRRRSPF